MKTKNTKRSLLLSGISLLLCASMFVGSTFAWFTDTVSSGRNIIQSGNLDIELDYYNGTQWATVNEATDLFTDNLWEPGHTEIAYLRLSNLGTLALKYQLGINIDSETEGTNATGSFKLSDYIYMGVVEGIDGETAAYIDRADAVAATSGAGKISAGYTKEGEMQKDAEELYLAVVVYMPETVGNEANYKTGTTAPEIALGINLVATQLNVEADSFDENYDKDTSLSIASVSNVNELRKALDNEIKYITLTENIVVDNTFSIDYDANIDGNGYTLTRTDGTALMTADLDTPVIHTGVVFNVESGSTLTLEDIIVDGGAIWTGEVNPVLQRGTVNTGVTATGALVATESNAHIVLGDGAVLQNNDGANAVSLNTRVGCTLTINGGEIINNSSASGAIWGGGEIILNSGKINNNYGGIGGAIRVVTNIGTVLTMNGGEMNHNYSAGVGGAIWAGSSRSNNVYVLNGGEMAYNYSAQAGGAIYAGYYETVKIGGDFKMHDNSAPSYGAIRFHDHASFVMTGGEIYNNGENSLFLYNNSASITGGKITDNVGYSGGLGLTWGNAEVDGVIAYNLLTNHNTAYLAKDFGVLKFTVNENSSNFSQFNFKPTADYVYTAGDEAKLVCMNEGYVTYWDAESGTFRLKAE